MSTQHSALSTQHLGFSIQHSAPGFSLLELLAVLILMGFMAGVSVPALGRFLDTLDFRKQVREITAVLRYARLEAVVKGRPVQVKLIEEPMGLELAGAITAQRPLDLGEEGQLTMEPEEVVFYPEGRSTPALLVFVQGERSRAISLDPLTGLPLLTDPADQ